jgi:hypothetical protein
MIAQHPFSAGWAGSFEAVAGRLADILGGTTGVNGTLAERGGKVGDDHVPALALDIEVEEHMFEATRIPSHGTR